MSDDKLIREVGAIFYAQEALRRVYLCVVVNDKPTRNECHRCYWGQNSHHATRMYGCTDRRRYTTAGECSPQLRVHEGQVLFIPVTLDRNREEE